MRRVSLDRQPQQHVKNQPSSYPWLVVAKRFFDCIEKYHVTEVTLVGLLIHGKLLEQFSDEWAKLTALALIICMLKVFQKWRN